MTIQEVIKAAGTGGMVARKSRRVPMIYLVGPSFIEYNDEVARVSIQAILADDWEVVDAVTLTPEREAELRRRLSEAEEEGRQLRNDPLATGGNFYMLGEKIKLIKIELGSALPVPTEGHEAVGGGG